MRRTDLVAAIFIAVAAVSSAMGWDKAATNDEQRIWDRVQGKAPKGARRHRTWRKVRAAHLFKFDSCAVCESTTKLQVHHIVPFHVAPGLELDPANLITLCENNKYGIRCHQLIGHLGMACKAEAS
jgi:5-methylcytosine-specific restriction endonuclease McrA